MTVYYYHKKEITSFGFYRKLKLVSPPERNGYETMICEFYDYNKRAFVVIEDRPENFF